LRGGVRYAGCVPIGRRSRVWTGAALILAAGCGGSHSVPTPQSDIRMPLYAGMQGHVVVSTSTATAIARGMRLVVATRRQLEQVAPALHAANPKLIIEVYINAMFVHPDDGSVYPSSWYLRDASGAQVRSRLRGNYLMNPGSTATFRGVAGWSAWVAQTCHSALRAVPLAAGCFLDMTSAAPLQAGYDAGGNTPVKPGTGRPFSAAQYLRMTGAVSRQVERVTGHPVVSNGLQSGLHSTRASTRLLIPFAHGFEIEHWMGLRQREARTISGWEANLQLVMDLARLGRRTLVNIQTVEGRTEQSRAFALASFLLAAGRDQFLQIEPPGHGAPSWQDPSPLYAAPLGSPAETARTVRGYRAHGLFLRRYTHGLVVVNPGLGTVAFNPPAGYVPAAGGPAPSGEIAPLTGVIFVRRS
jgi:putative glycosyl hydrolase-like family 15 (GHL15) protein